MPPLTDAQKREIRQLWDAAVTYWNLAQSIVSALPNERRQVMMELTPTDIAQYYDTAIPTDQTERRLNILLAHLSSAAIRLYTIEERFEKAGQTHDRVFENYLDLCKKESDLPRWLDSRFSDFAHQMLRDNAAHIEEDPGKIIYPARQEVIRRKKVEVIFNAFRGVMAKFTDELPKRVVMAAPSS